MLLRVREIKNAVGKITSTYKHQIKYIRMQPSNRSRQNGQGEQVFAKWKIFLEPEIDIIETDKLEYESKTYSILELYKVRDRKDKHNHTEVWI